MVHKHADQLVANGLVNKRCRYRGVNTAREPKHNALLTDLGLDTGHSLVNMVLHNPVGASSADIQGKPLQHGSPLNRMRDLRMKLQAIEPTVVIGHACNGAACRRGHKTKAGRQLTHAIAVTHPDLQHAVALGRGEVGNALEQASVTSGPHVGRSKLSMVAGLNPPAKLQSHGLHAVANTQHGQATMKNEFGRLIGLVIVGAGMAAREHNAFDAMSLKVSLQPVVCHVTGVHLAVNMQLTQTPSNKLGELRTEVENKNLVVVQP